jgi:hypothetical protein
MTELQIQHIPIDNLIAYARNPRKNDAVVDKMCASIKEFGFRPSLLKAMAALLMAICASKLLKNWVYN